MVFYWKPAIRNRDNYQLRYAKEVGQKTLLILPAPDVFENSVRGGYVKCFPCEGERLVGLNLDVSSSWKSLLERVASFQAGGGDPMRIRVPSF